MALTEQVILTALGDWDIFNEHGVAMKFAVNVPVSAFVKLPIPQMLREARPRAANWPGLMLEVTEDQIIHDLNLANDVAGALRELNCTLALDDFGAGYSSLARLQAIAVQRAQDRPQLCDELRPRPAQCRPVRDHRRARQALRAQDRGGRHRDHAREPQAARHRLSDVGQGYLFAKPMPKGQLIGLMRKRLMAAPVEPQR